MALVTFLFFYLALFLTSLLFSALGLGGGSLYVPIQLFYGIDFHTAAATSLFLILTTSFSSTLVFQKAKVVDWAMALVLEAATILGGFLGGFSSGHFTGRFLTYLFAGFIAFAAFFMAHSPDLQPRAAAERQRFYLWKRKAGAESYCLNLALALPVCLVAGALSGLLGIGGGIFNILIMVLLCGVPMNVAVGSSAFMVGLTAFGGFLGHLLSGPFDWKTALLLAPGIFLGAQIGARHSIKVEKKRLKVYFGYFLYVLAAVIVLRAALH